MAFEIPVKVRFCEPDALGHISYFLYLEKARTDFLAEVGVWFGSNKLEKYFSIGNVRFYQSRLLQSKINRSDRSRSPCEFQLSTASRHQRRRTWRLDCNRTCK